MTYAAETSVPVERSQREIEVLVTKHGATSFYRGQEVGRAIVGFQLKDRRIQFEVALPRPDEYEYTVRNGRKAKRTPEQVRVAVDQAERARWRALALTIKAKLVSIETGVESFEEAFLAQIIVPGEGRAMRFAQLALPAIAKAYDTGALPPLLPSGD